MWGLKRNIKKANLIIEKAKKDFNKLESRIDARTEKKFETVSKNLEAAIKKENLAEIKKYSKELSEITQEIHSLVKSIVREYAEAIIIALILALIIRTYVVQAFKIPSGSMLETLQIGDHILVNKFIYWFKDPQRGDVMVFRYPVDETRDFIKRVIAVGGDTIKSKNKKIFLNHKKIYESYTVYKDPVIYPRENPAIFGDEGVRDNFGQITVPEGNYFMMGDNRDRSLDSRFWKFVDREKIKGKAFMIYWSWNDTGTFLDKVRWGRIGKIIH